MNCLHEQSAWSCRKSVDDTHVGYLLDDDGWCIMGCETPCDSIPCVSNRYEMDLYGAVDFEDERCTLARYRTIIRDVLITAIVTVHAAPIEPQCTVTKKSPQNQLLRPNWFQRKIDQTPHGLRSLQKRLHHVEAVASLDDAAHFFGFTGSNLWHGGTGTAPVTTHRVPMAGAGDATSCTDPGGAGNDGCINFGATPNQKRLNICY